MRGRSRFLLSIWLVALAALQVVAFVQLWRFFVRTEHGQLLDTIALAGNTIGQDEVDGVVSSVLNAMSVVAIAVATAVIGFIALIRRRILLAVVAIVLIAGATLSVQLLKSGLYRPELGVDVERASAGNSFPSGHTAVAAAVAVALVLVLPAQLRGVGALIGALYAALAGVATLSAGWHRPSDAVAAMVVVGGWATIAALILLIAQRPEDGMEPGGAHRIAITALTIAAAVLLTVAVLALRLTDQVLTTPPEELSRNRLFTAYAGSSAGIAGAASLMMALVLTSVHRVVLRRPAAPRPDELAVTAPAAN